MAKGKYKRWLEDEGITLLSAWARDGMTDEDLAKKMNISTSTLYEWKKKYPEISEALKKGKEIVDIEVENSLLKRAKGYNAKVKKHFKLKTVDFDPVTGRKVSEREELKEVEDEVHVPADTTAQFFWLKNRRPDKWRDRPEAPQNDDKPSNNLFEAITSSTKKDVNTDGISELEQTAESDADMVE